MDAPEIAKRIIETFDDLDVVEASGDTFFFCDPDKSMDPTRRRPFATIVTSGAHDALPI